MSDITIEDDEYGHSIELNGIVHKLMLWKQDEENIGEYVLFMLPEHCPNGLNLDQDDVNALHAFLGRYVKE